MMGEYSQRMAESPEDIVNDKMMVGRVLQKISELRHERYCEVIIKRFGLNGSSARTLRDIGGDYGVQAERIRQIEAVCLRIGRSFSGMEWSQGEIPAERRKRCIEESFARIIERDKRDKDRELLQQKKMDKAKKDAEIKQAAIDADARMMRENFNEWLRLNPAKVDLRGNNCLNCYFYNAPLLCGHPELSDDFFKLIEFEACELHEKKQVCFIDQGAGI